MIAPEVNARWWDATSELLNAMSREDAEAAFRHVRKIKAIARRASVSALPSEVVEGIDNWLGEADALLMGSWTEDSADARAIADVMRPAVLVIDEAWRSIRKPATDCRKS